jgi:hypothetical protein
MAQFNPECKHSSHLLPKFHTRCGLARTECPLPLYIQENSGWITACLNAVPLLRRGLPLRLFAITKTGLLAMTISVAALWSCIALEQATLRRAEKDARACLKTLQNLRERAIPATEPVPLFHREIPSAS